MLSDEQRRDVVAGAYAISAAFGLYVEVHAATGARSSQIAHARCRRSPNRRGAEAADAVEPEGPEPRGREPASRYRSRPAGEAVEGGRAGRDAGEPLLLMNRRRALERSASIAACSPRPRRPLRLPDGATMYCCGTPRSRARCWPACRSGWSRELRHAVAMIEKTYSKFIADHGDAQMRRALFDVDAPAAGNVVPLVR